MSEKTPITSIDKGMEQENLGKGLKSRHIQMIAIGGAIGVGLFYGSSSAIKLAGPAAILSYAIVGLIIYIVSRCAGEMAVAEPVSGSYVSYGSRYIHPFIGFMISWSMVFGSALIAAAEYNALGKYVQYWFPEIPIGLSALICVGIILAINLAAVSLYGEIEYWLSFIKVATILLMIILGLALIFFGIGHNGVPIGLNNLTAAEGGFFAGGLKGFLYSLVFVCFAYGGIESLTITAAESVNVKRDIPKAINSVFWRILIFYVGAIFVMLSLQPWDQIGTNGSPFVTVFSSMGIPAAATIINFVVITAAMSSMNFGLYERSRLLYNLALQGNAPKIFTRVNRKQVPYAGTVFNVCAQLCGILVNVIIPKDAFTIFASVYASVLILIWLVILVSHLNFRKAKIKTGEDKNLEYKSVLYPYANYFAIAFLMMIVVVMGVQSFTRLVGLSVFIGIICISYMIMNKAKKSSRGVKHISESKFII